MKNSKSWYGCMKIDNFAGFTHNSMHTLKLFQTRLSICYLELLFQNHEQFCQQGKTLSYDGTYGKIMKMTTEKKMCVGNIETKHESRYEIQTNEQVR